MRELVYTIVLGSHGSPYPKPPLSMNDRMHWARERKIKTDLRALVVSHLQRKGVPKGAEHVTVQLFYRPPTRNHPDPDNLAKTTKTVADALLPAKPAYLDRRGKPHAGVLGYGLIPDDNQAHCARPEAIIVDSTGRERSAWWVRLTIRYPEERP